MMNSHKLKIGLDYHGVIDDNINYFTLFCIKAKQRGHYIYIITGGPKIMVEHNLKLKNIPYDMCFAISDYYQALGKAIQEKTGDFIIPENLWNVAKGEFCCRNKINIHIDDSVKYQNWFSTPYCYYNPKTKKGIIYPNIELNFNNYVDDILDEIERIVP